MISWVGPLRQAPQLLRMAYEYEDTVILAHEFIQASGNLGAAWRNPWSWLLQAAAHLPHHQHHLGTGRHFQRCASLCPSVPGAAPACTSTQSPSTYSVLSSIQPHLAFSTAEPRPNLTQRPFCEAIGLSCLVSSPSSHTTQTPPPTMSHWRAKTLDLGCFVGSRVVRDHTKRTVFERFEPERQVFLFARPPSASQLTSSPPGKPSAT